VIYKPKEQMLKIVFDYYEQDLKKFITSKDYKIDEEKIKLVIKKILNGVAFIHSKKVLHRDLKPQNILVDSFCTPQTIQKMLKSQTSDSPD
jgi:serine/threonine protein kinase